MSDKPTTSSSTKEKYPLLPVPVAYPPVTHPTQKFAPSDNGGSLKEKLLSFLRSLLIFSSLLILSLIILAAVKDDFVSVPNSTIHMHKMIPKLPTSVGTGLGSSVDWETFIAETEFKCKENQDDESKSKERKEVTSVEKWEELIKKFKCEEIKEKMYTFKYRKSWAQACLILMIIGAVLDVAVTALSFLSCMKPRLQKILMIGVIVVSLLVLFLTAAVIGLFNSNFTDVVEEAEKLSEDTKKSEKLREEKGDRKDQEYQLRSAIVKSFANMTELVGDSAAHGISYINLAVVINLNILNVIAAVILIVMG